MWRRLAEIVLIIGGYGVLYWLGVGPLTHVDILRWTAIIVLPIAAMLSLLLAADRPLVGLISFGGYLLGLALGWVIGEPLYAWSERRLAEELAQPGAIQTWEPQPQGWLITAVVFLIVSALGWWWSGRLADR